MSFNIKKKENEKEPNNSKKSTVQETQEKQRFNIKKREDTAPAVSSTKNQNSGEVWTHATSSKTASTSPSTSASKSNLYALQEQRRQAQVDMDIDTMNRLDKQIKDNKEDVLSRIVEGFKKTNLGGLKSSAASNIDAGTTLYAATQGGRTQRNQEILSEYKYSLDRAKRDMNTMLEENRKNPGTFSDGELQSQQYIIDEWQRKYDAISKVIDDQVQENATSGAHDIADTIQESANKDIERAKEVAYLGKFGELLVDAGASLAQVAGDAVTSAAIGAPQSMLPFAYRAFGGGAQSARQDGADIKGQVLYGGAQAAKEVFTEKMFNLAMPFAKAYGGGAMDDIVQNGIAKAVDRFAKTEAGQRFLNGGLQLAASGISEGLEELIGDWMEWQMPRIYGGEVATAGETLENSLYDFLVGVASGTIGSVISPSTYRYQSEDQQDSQYAGQPHPTGAQIERPEGSFTTGSQNAAESVLGSNTDADVNMDAGVQAAYEAGKAELPRARANLETDAQVAAYEQGRRDAILTQKPIENTDATAYTDVINTKEAANNGEQGVHLREGSQRTDGTNPGGQVRQLEEGTGRDQSGDAQRRPRDGEAANVSYGRKVSTAELGIKGGSKADGVFLIKSGTTKSIQQAQQIAKQNGKELILFGGHDLHTDKAPDGARGYTDGKRIFARIDDPDFTVDQIVRHETGHNLIAEGKVNLDDVRNRVASVVGDDKMDTAAKLYAAAYSGTEMTPDEIWEEVVCDSLGDMNIFEGIDTAESFVEDFLSVTKQETESSQSTTRGPPVTTDKYSARIGGNENDRRRTDETRKDSYEANRILHWTETTEGRREAPEHESRFLRRMGQSGATLRRVGTEAVFGYTSVPYNRAGSYAKKAAQELSKLGTKNFFIFDGELQWNDGRTTYGSSNYAATLSDGSIGINNSTELTDDVAPPAELAAHETIHMKFNSGVQAAVEFRKAVVANAKVTSPMFRRYFNLINYGYHNGTLDFNNVQDRAEFYREFISYVGGFIYAENVDVSSMFEDYGAVCSALEKALGVKAGSITGKISEHDDIQNSRRVDTSPIGQEIKRQMDEGKTFKESVDAIYQSLIDDYGAIEPGEKPYRDIQVPKKSFDKRTVSRTVRTAMEAEATPDDFIPLLKEETVKGGFSFVPITNDDTVKTAEKYILDRGWQKALVDWTTDVRKGRTGDQVTAVGALLYNHAVNAEDFQAALDIFTDYQAAVRNSARGLQAARILKTLTPENRLYMIRKDIQNMVDELDLPEIEIPQDLVDSYKKAKTNKEIDDAVGDIQEYVASQIPPARLFSVDWFNALRYLNMLGNLKTQVRNITGNVGMRIIGEFENVVASGIEHLAGGKAGRTRSIFVNKELHKLAKADFANVRSQALGEDKYTIGNENKSAFLSGVNDKRRVFKSAPMEAYRKATNWAMNNQIFGDEGFSKSAYARALGEYLTANKVTAEQFDDADWKKKNAKFLDKARQASIKRAQELTFRDSNAISDWIQKVGRRPDTPKAARKISEGIMPFRRTPANVLIRAEEYSPLGIINTVAKAVQAKKGEATGTDVINSLSKTLTGTGIFMAGMLFQSFGWVRGGDDDDEKKARYDELTGHQTYALEIHGILSITMDWLTPTSMPFFMGVQLKSLMEEDGFEAKDLERAMLSIADPMLQMSMMQGLNDTLTNLRYATDANIGQLAVNAALSYLMQGLTNSLLGQVARTLDDESTMTYVDRDSALPSWLQKTIGTASRKVPVWDYNQIPYIDAWGRTEDAGSALDNFLNPAWVSDIEASPMEEELLRLYEATGVDVIPTRADKSFKVNEETKYLTADEYVKYAEKRGKTAYDLLTKITRGSAYKALTDEDKAEIVKDVYSYSNAVAKMSVSDYEPAGSITWVSKAIEAEKEYGIKPETFIAAYAATSGIEGWTYANKTNKNGDKIGIENSKGFQVMAAVYEIQGLTDKQRKALYEYFGVSDAIWHFNKAAVAEQLEKMKKIAG